MSNILALHGGNPIRESNWPAWPSPSHEAYSFLKEICQDQRWSISGAWTGKETFDSRLARAAEEFFNVKHCIPVDHGSNALLIALRALGVTPGCEVIIPGLTWVACASAVLRLGAYPVLVDVDPNTQCMDPNLVESAITPLTRVIMVVHLNSCMADMTSILRIADRQAIPILEDCSQCHGAKWQMKRAGTLGKIGVFSLHQGKLLAAGEGGLAITNDPELASAMERLRADGRRYSKSNIAFGEQHLEELSGIIGNNCALSEFQSALALDGLSRLDYQNSIRATNAELLDSLLTDIEGLKTTCPHDLNNLRAYYHYVVRYDREIFGGLSNETICKMLSAELGTWIHPTYRPLNDHPLYNPLADSYYTKLLPDHEKLNPKRFELKNAAAEFRTSILFHQSLLLDSTAGMHQISDAFKKILNYIQLKT
jgi:dTDP-4-amino-4,6-dideoxygalactose transaminase